MVQAKQNDNQSKETLTNKLNNPALKRSLAGGLLGAAVGYLASAENGKKIKENINKEKLSELGSGIKENSVKAVDSVKQSASNLFSKESNEEANSTDEMGSGENNETTITAGNEKKQSKDSNKQTEQLNNRLDRLEDMLLKLIDEKKSGSNSNQKDHNESNEKIDEQEKDEDQQQPRDEKKKSEPKDNQDDGETEESEYENKHLSSADSNEELEQELSKKKVSERSQEKDEQKDVSEEEEDGKGYSVLSDKDEEESVLLPGFKKESS